MLRAQKLQLRLLRLLSTCGECGLRLLRLSEFVVRRPGERFPHATPQKTAQINA
jgi:hypothetical protein